MNIRTARHDDLPAIMAILQRAKAFMSAHGNPHQWEDGYPSEALMEEEIRLGHCFVCETPDLGTVGTFCFSTGDDPTYADIEGQWLNDRPYGVIHRLASDGRTGGIARQCIAWCAAHTSNLRADTHADNLIMQRLLADNGFVRCGIIYTRQSPRIAYHKT